MTDNIENVLSQFKKLGDKNIAKHSQRFFKTGKGEYGEGDIFLGISVPIIRQFAKNHRHLPLKQIERILHSLYHEERLLAAILLTDLAKAGDENLLKSIYSLYIKNTPQINNWDIVDTSAPDIVGRYLWCKDKQPLYKLARSSILWEKRISILATFYFIKQNEFTDALAISEILITDPHDLIQKACGWMLREIGKRDQEIEESFLKEHYNHMPRTMLRYAIEKFPENKRLQYLHGKI